VQLNFHLVMIEDHNTCIWDGVKVYENTDVVDEPEEGVVIEGGKRKIKHFCGYLENEMVITSTSNQVSILFYSDSAVQTSGFLASYRAVDAEAEESDSSLDENFLLTIPQGLTTQDSDEQGRILT